jgi:hypothetical protein
MNEQFTAMFVEKKEVKNFIEFFKYGVPFFPREIYP